MTQQDTQPPAETLAEAREAAALAFDVRARKASHPEVATLERDHAKVIRAGEGDEYDAVQAAVIALTRRAGGDDRQWPDIGEDPMKARPYDDRMAVSAAAIRKAYTVQQPIVPNQTALVWRWHLGALLEAEIRLRSTLARDDHSGDPDGDEPPFANGDAIPAKEAFDAWRRAQPSGDERFPYDIAKAAFLAGRESATPKPTAGGDAGASFVDRVCEVLRKEQDRLDAEAGDYLMDTSDCINVIRENAAALAIPAPPVEGATCKPPLQVAASVERLRRMVAAGRIDAAYGDFSHPAATMIDDVRKLLAALSEGDAEKLREEVTRLRKVAAPLWFYPADGHESDCCMWSVDEVIDYADLPPGDHVVEVNTATPLPSIWCAVRVTADEDADERYTFTPHATADAARAALSEGRSHG